ncbi:MAG: hypothetical protein ACT4NX_03565 [Deltaproteobacteria bacterium]
MSPITVKERVYNVLFEPISGGYRITAPAFTDLEIECQCQSLEEGREIARYALKEYIGILTKHHQPIPNNDDSSPQEMIKSGFSERIGVYLFTESQE